jgi:predicted metal-dependent HD superfamily phosphohydrolase
VFKTTLIHKARARVEALLKAAKPEWVKYHNFEHAKAVAKASKTIGTACRLSAEDLEGVILAAWFHDAGYVEAIEGHEEKSVEIATSFLRENGYPQKKIARVAGCIRATKMPQNPKTLMEQVLCDADISHLASQDFLEVSELIRLEIEHRMGRKLAEAEWLTMNTLFVAGHQYHTDYARSKYAPQHAANLAALKERLNQLKDRKMSLPRRKAK